MIKSKEDYKFYLEADRIALGEKRKKPRIFGDEIWGFERLLRKVEYYNNCKTAIIYKPFQMYLLLKFHMSSIRLGFTIPINVIGPGLAIVHRGTIVINNATKIGSNCRIHVCTNIGANSGSHFAPKIGNNVYIGPGAKIFGNISIADGIAIGANSVVNKSFYEEGIGIAGAPANKINDKGSEGFVVKSNRDFGYGVQNIVTLLILQVHTLLKSLEGIFLTENLERKIFIRKKQLLTHTK